ncbi:glycosyltransferase family 87 protein [Singulisphaera rosea]
MTHPHIRRTLVLSALFLGPAAIWIALAHRIVPPLILAPEPGRPYSWILRSYLKGPRDTRTVEFYLARWYDSSTAILIAWALFGSILVLLNRWDASNAETQTPDVRRATRRASLVLGVLALPFLLATVLCGLIQDYSLFLQIWSEVRAGHDPWYLVPGVFGIYPLNAYGPLYNILGLLAGINPFVPKLLFAYCYLLFAAWLVKSYVERNPPGVLGAIGLLLWFANPYVWVEIPVFGHFDILVGSVCVASVHARVRDRDVVSGVAIASGVLLKYMPIVLLPFLILDRGKIRWRVLVSALMTIALGLAIAYLVWGAATFRPLSFAATRFPTQLSIFRFLRGGYSPISGFWSENNLDSFIVVFLFVALLRAWSWYRVSWPGLTGATVVAILTTLLFYQVGFAQYQIVFFCMLSYWLIRDGIIFRSGPALPIASACYFTWLSVFNSYYCVHGLDVDLPFFGQGNVEDLLGLPTFLLGVTLLACLVRAAKREAADALTDQSAD